ncbi:fasciclin domain-containing protein [Nocardioides sp.]|uniref:fasciclin domain-containing protein n=1 Tax=Nocardioides sp. TaxID=35761 RepID=UPI003517FD72
MSKRSLRVGVAGLLTSVVAGTALAAAPAQAAHEPGTRSLATLLAKDKGFDRNRQDFDILEAAVKAVLKAKPNSPVGVLAKGNTRVTAFLPTDGAFRWLVRDLTGRSYNAESSVFKKLASTVDIDTIEAVLLYHVIAGKTIDSKGVIARDDKAVRTALGPTFIVRVQKNRIVLSDRDGDARNPIILKTDINKGNKQIGHAIDRVLRPVNL